MKRQKTNDLSHQAQAILSMGMDTLVGIQTARAILNKSESTIYRYVAEGKIKKRLGRFAMSDLQALVTGGDLESGLRASLLMLSQERAETLDLKTEQRLARRGPVEPTEEILTKLGISQADLYRLGRIVEASGGLETLMKS